MKRALGVVAVSLAMSLSASQAFAQAQTKAGHFFAGVEVGYTQLTDRSGEFASGLVSVVGGAASVTQDNSAYLGRIFGGYKFIENLDFELGYSQTNSFGYNFTGVSGGAIPYSGSATAKASGADYSILLRPNVSTGMNGLFLRLGGHSLKTDQTVSLSVANLSISQNQGTSGSGWLAGIGYDAAISRNADVRFSYTRLEKISGQSGANANLLNLGLVVTF